MEHERLQGKLRKKILELNYRVKSGHTGCSLSCIDIMISIFKQKKTGDTFLLSKGHAAAALYSILNEFGEIPDDVLNTYYKDNTTLSAHPAPLKYAAIPFATGSLGHGLPLGTGIAKANQLKASGYNSYVLMSDGETNEGTTWEAAHFAAANKLDNLFVIIDKNGLQGFGNITDILGDTASAKLWEAMGFEVAELDGHDINGLMDAQQRMLANKDGRPKLIIANTIKGKGVSYMERSLDWHYLSMNETQYQQAVSDIETNYNGA